MLAAVVVLLRSLRLICGGHRAAALENVALRQQLSAFRRTVGRRNSAREIDCFGCSSPRSGRSHGSCGDNIAHRHRLGERS
jgi:hypothetical protein